MFWKPPRLSVVCLCLVAMSMFMGFTGAGALHAGLVWNCR